MCFSSETPSRDFTFRVEQILHMVSKKSESGLSFCAWVFYWSTVPRRHLLSAVDFDPPFVELMVLVLDHFQPSSRTRSSWATAWRCFRCDCDLFRMRRWRSSRASHYDLSLCFCFSFCFHLWGLRLGTLRRTNACFLRSGAAAGLLFGAGLAFTAVLGCGWGCSISASDNSSTAPSSIYE